jgi:hypothetical protein
LTALPPPRNLFRPKARQVIVAAVWKPCVRRVPEDLFDTFKGSGDAAEPMELAEGIEPPTC